MLEISLFGSFEVRRDGLSICKHWIRHANRLLALLTLNHNRAVSTDWILSALLIPDSVLPQSLSALYEVLGKDRIRIHHQNHQIHFDTTGVEVDLFEFERLIAKGSSESLVQAVKIHRGGLLKDWEEESWFYDERENSLAEYLDALNTLSHAAIVAHDYDLATSYLRRHVKAFPEMDGAWTRLIEIYGMTGSSYQIEETQQQYHLALRKRSIEESREFVPSTRFRQAYEQALHQTISPQVLISVNSERLGDVIPTASPPTGQKSETIMFEPVGGAVPVDSPFYLSRPAAALAFDALARRDSFLLIKGARQVGKSSLLTRLLHIARESGAQVVRSDWQKLPQAALESDQSFLCELADTFADHLELDIKPETHFVTGRAGTTSFERFLKRDVLPSIAGSLVWIIDEVDRIFDLPYRDDIFAMLRSWHGERANDFSGRWQKLTVIMAYATEAYLFISNLDQSPFNVGTRIELDDFTREQVGEMNRRYNSLMVDELEVDRLYALVGGHPYLVRRCLQEMQQHGLSIAEVESSVERGDSFFKDHLGRMRLAIQRDGQMEEALWAYLNEGNTPNLDIFIRLRAAGVMRGDSSQDMSPRCRLYDLYLRRVFV